MDGDWSARAAEVLPGGSLGNMGGDLTIVEGTGSRVRDDAGREYVDFLLGSGPMFVGHAHPEVNEAVRRQLARGTTFFANNPAAIELAEAIRDAVPCARQVRFLASGTEADMYAMRIVRAFRGRELILKFEGGYHGMSDPALMSLWARRPGNFPRPVPDSAGIPRAVQDQVLVAPFNDAAGAAALIDSRAEEIAGVIVEPLQRLIPPAPGFLETLREATARHGIPLIFDEVVTGFRLAYGGAQEAFGVTPDLCTLGKIIGGGFPLAAVAGRADILAVLDRAAGEDRFCPQIGTLSGNPVACVAGLATLAILRRPGAYAAVEATGRALMAGMEAALRRRGIAAGIVGLPALFDVVFGLDAPPRNHRDMLRADAALQRAVNAGLRARGVLKGESKYYVGLCHDAADVALTLAAFEESLAAARA
ncbi:MAG: aminotransferase class III-fold pyridoxal phosphate-dependent enzyme [Acetobacteraceae bacterium]|nr:aminotransferase class III-fold pyridoxal phosphate-dependent enzyme [Acetobacteraceae bacterium]